MYLPFKQDFPGACFCVYSLYEIWPNGCLKFMGECVRLEILNIIRLVASRLMSVAVIAFRLSPPFPRYSRPRLLLSQPPSHSMGSRSRATSSSRDRHNSTISLRGTINDLSTNVNIIIKQYKAFFTSQYYVF